MGGPMSWRALVDARKPRLGGLSRRCQAKRMIQDDRLRARFPRATALVEPHFDMLRKAISFALIGLVNVGVDTTVFLLVYSYLKSHEGALRPLDALALWCACTSLDTLLLITAN